jgi:RNA polymerase sigma-70 factor (sigma-E family)
MPGSSLAPPGVIERALASHLSPPTERDPIPNRLSKDMFQRRAGAMQPPASLACSPSGSVERPADSEAVRAEAWQAAYEAHATALLRLCILLAGRKDVAEDLVQETFVRTHDAIPRLDTAQVGPYLRTSAINVWRNRLRRASLEHRIRLDRTPKDELPYEERDALWQAIRRLPPRQRACVVLRFYADMTEREIATALGCAAGTVKSQTSRALRRLGKELEDVNRG